MATLKDFDIPPATILELIRPIIQERLQMVIDEEVGKAKAQLAQRLQGFAAQSALELAQWADVNVRSDRIVITLRLPEMK